MDNVEKVCEEVLPLPYPEAEEKDLMDDEWACQQQVRVDRKLLAQAIRQGKLVIPRQEDAEKGCKHEDMFMCAADKCYRFSPKPQTNHIGEKDAMVCNTKQHPPLTREQAEKIYKAVAEVSITCMADECRENGIQAILEAGGGR